MFDPGVCKAAIKHHGYCSGGWTRMSYSQKYPYYYDEYQRYLSGGGAAAALTLENCAWPTTRVATSHGFGTIGSGHHYSHAGG